MSIEGAMRITYDLKECSTKAMMIVEKRRESEVNKIHNSCSLLHDRACALTTEDR